MEKKVINIYNWQTNYKTISEFGICKDKVRRRKVTKYTVSQLKDKLENEAWVGVQWLEDWVSWSVFLSDGSIVSITFPYWWY